MHIFIQPNKGPFYLQHNLTWLSCLQNILAVIHVDPRSRSYILRAEYYLFAAPGWWFYLCEPASCIHAIPDGWKLQCASANRAIKQNECENSELYPRWIDYLLVLTVYLKRAHLNICKPGQISLSKGAVKYSMSLWNQILPQMLSK